MSDPFSTALDEDPAADFLAREQQELAGLDDDGFVGLTSDSPAAVDVNQENPALSGDGLDFLDGEIVTSNDSVPVQDYLGDTDFGGGSLDPLVAPASEDINGGIDVLLDPLDVPSSGVSDDRADVLLDPLDAPASEEVSGSIGVLLDPLDAPASEEVSGSIGVLLDPFDAPASEEVNGDDSPLESEVAPTQKTLLWREEQLKKIAEKDKNEEAKLEEWRNTAKRELEEWYARQAEQVEKHKKNNRVAEAEFVKERDETTPGNEWERISRLCDFNPKNNKNTKDVSKLRSLLLQLKQNPLARSSTA